MRRKQPTRTRRYSWSLTKASDIVDQYRMHMDVNNEDGRLATCDDDEYGQDFDDGEVDDDDLDVWIDKIGSCPHSA